ncbi:hypothetical protein [Undibacterium sp. Ji22W]|uniref:hypothetical protein n=1 Tax=Undibacterium sp. Ji22W TaxID=3413038 RepID=UPI003BF2C803
MRTSGTENQIIWLHPEAPLKPIAGQACNGCGVCCLADPCPVARIFLWQWRGACRALIWSSVEGHYRCGMVVSPSEHLLWLPPFLEPLTRSLVKRWIAAGIACDSDAEIVSDQEYQ